VLFLRLYPRKERSAEIARYDDYDNLSMLKMIRWSGYLLPSSRPWAPQGDHQSCQPTRKFVVSTELCETLYARVCTIGGKVHPGQVIVSNKMRPA